MRGTPVIRRAIRTTIMLTVIAGLLGVSYTQLDRMIGTQVRQLIDNPAATIQRWVDDLRNPAPPDADTSAVPPPELPSHPQLDKLTINDGTVGGYDRDFYGQSWSDDVTVAGGKNGCDTRNDVLRRDALRVDIKSGTDGCKVIDGQWKSPYTGEVLNRERVDIDHIVPLAANWQAGGSTWTDEQRRNYANDPSVLLAVDATSNRSKNDRGPDRWLPNLDHCGYAKRWIAVKTRYHLTVTTQEHHALAAILSTAC